MASQNRAASVPPMAPAKELPPPPRSAGAAPDADDASAAHSDAGLVGCAADLSPLVVGEGERERLQAAGDDDESPVRSFGLRRCPAVSDLTDVPGDVELEAEVFLDFVPLSVAVAPDAPKLSPSAVKVPVQSLAPLISIKRMLSGMASTASSKPAELYHKGRQLDDDFAEVYACGIRGGDVIHCVL